MTPLSYHDYSVSVSGSSRQQCSGIPLKLLCLFSSIVHHKNFLIKYLVVQISFSLQTFMTFRNKICTSQNFHMAWCVILCSIGCIDVPSKGIEQACSWASCGNIKVHLVLIYTLAFSNVLLVLVLNFMVHKSSYCKCCLAWCQVRTFLLFTIWTHPLQMREYPLQYAGTDRIKKISL